jgi:hypothetical protein
MTRAEQLTLALKRNRGGKGQGPSPREVKLAKALGMYVHFVIPTGKRKPYPPHYTIDCARIRQGIAIAIEVDGPSHRVLAVKSADRRKTQLLRSWGWHVFRVTNDDVDKRFERTVRMLQSKINRL